MCETSSGIRPEFALQSQLHELTTRVFMYRTHSEGEVLRDFGLRKKARLVASGEVRLKVTAWNWTRLGPKSGRWKNRQLNEREHTRNYHEVTLTRRNDERGREKQAGSTDLICTGAQPHRLLPIHTKSRIYPRASAFYSIMLAHSLGNDQQSQTRDS